CALSVSAAETRWFKLRYPAITSLVGEISPTFLSDCELMIQAPRFYSLLIFIQLTLSFLFQLHQ
ncbi:MULTISPECIES: hypothetical protein, partial [Providencia]|uniref:hypothetical protein n=1 Tax=Providencia TaxID=586 RepID=UPI0034D4273F